MSYLCQIDVMKTISNEEQNVHDVDVKKRAGCQNGRAFHESHLDMNNSLQNIGKSNQNVL